MHRLRHKAEAQGGRLLRFLFLRLGAVSADSSSARRRTGCCLLLCVTGDDQRADPNLARLAWQCAYQPAFFTLLRRAGTHTVAEYCLDPGSAAHRCALRSIRGTSARKSIRRNSSQGCPLPATSHRQHEENQLERQRLVHVCFGAQNGLKSDITPSPKSAITGRGTSTRAYPACSNKQVGHDHENPHLCGEPTDWPYTHRGEGVGGNIKEPGDDEHPSPNCRQ